MKVSVIIPFRDRGVDLRRRANLLRVLDFWSDLYVRVEVVDDGRSGVAQFNRSAAYNRGMAMFPADVYIFAEADMLLPADQVIAAVDVATKLPGLVVPFTEYHALPDRASDEVRRNPSANPGLLVPEFVMRNRRSIGAINVVSQAAMKLVGKWDERFEGNWYDDDAMKIAFDMCCYATDWIKGPAYHLYHLPGHRGEHLTPEDRAATARNKKRLGLYQKAVSPGQIRTLTAGGDNLEP